MRLGIVGAGGHGKVVADAALAGQRFGHVVFVDDVRTESQLNCPVIGTIDSLLRGELSVDAVVIAIGDNGGRLRLQRQLVSAGLRLATVVHPAAVISPFARIGEGSVVFAGAVINPGTTIGAASIINTSATVDHDCTLGEAVHVSPGAHLAGGVGVGERTWIGIGAVVRQGIQIGAGVTVGAGAAVVSNIEPDSTVVGVPAKPYPRRPQKDHA